MTILLYNPLAGNGTCQAKCQSLTTSFGQDVHWVNLLTIDHLQTYLCTFAASDTVILCGGDGTLIHAANAITIEQITCHLLYYPSGSCNDFHNGMLHHPDSDLYDLRTYLTHLPIITVGKESHRVINSVGFGIDGHICHEGDHLKERTGQTMSLFQYTRIAFRSILEYRTPDATITMDGIEHHFECVWMAPTMYGRVYGGGLLCAPDQDRTSGRLTTVVVHSPSRWRIIIPFLAAFRGRHLRYKKVVTALTGKDIAVHFSEPRTLIIDGEALTNITDYHIHC